MTSTADPALQRSAATAGTMKLDAYWSDGVPVFVPKTVATLSRANHGS